MEKGLESEEGNLYKATDNLANKVTDKLSSISSDVNLSENQMQNGNSNGGFVVDYNKMANAFLLALNSSEVTGRIEKILNKILEKSNKQIVLNTGELIGATADAYDAALANNQTRGERGN